MRTLKFSPLITILLVLFVVLVSCKNEEEDNGDIDNKSVIQTNDTIKNKKFLLDLQKQIVAFKSTTKSTEAFTSSEDPIVVNLKDEVAKLFDPSNHPCSLPEKIAKKLKKAKDDGKPWAPKFVNNHIAEMPKEVLYIPRQGITNVLHWVTVKKVATGETSKELIVSSPTYNDLNVEDFILGGFNSFFYSLDCSGYLNAAIEGSAAIPGADIKNVAKSALETQNSMFIGGGVIVSPLYTAYFNDTAKLDTKTRIAVLSAIIQTLTGRVQNLTDADIVTLNSAYDAVWASKVGKSSFNGEASFSGKGGLGIGVAQISASSSGGGSMSRKSTFSSFNTYISKEKPLKDTSVTVGQIKALIATLKRENQ